MAMRAFLEELPNLASLLARAWRDGELHGQRKTVDELNQPAANSGSTEGEGK